MGSVSKRQRTLLGAEIQEGPVCRHHWLIDRPAGPVSKGVCRLCGEERDFQNYVEGSSWGYNVSLEELSGGSNYLPGIKVRDTSGDSELDDSE